MLLEVILTKLTGIGLFVITLGILVFVHEMGHFLAAKSVGVTVEEFAFGFGPRIVTFLRRGGTDYTIRALPLGGFVSMVGMQPEDVSVPNGLMSKPAWARAWVFIAGPLMNVVLAFIVLCSMGLITGIPKEQSREVVDVSKGWEAERIGLRVGDEVVAVDGRPVKDGGQLIQEIKSRPGKPITLTIRRAGRTLPPIKATPRPIKDPQTGETIGRLGFVPGWTFEQVSFARSVQFGLEQIQGFFVSLYHIVQAGQLRQNLGGPVRIFQESDRNAQLPPGHQFSMVGQLSISLAVFNLLPIPVLDGGHLAILLVEVLRRRRLGAEAHRVATVMGLVFIGVLFVYLMYSDLTR